MDICGDSGAFDFENECIRSTWTALVPASFVLILCLVSFINPKSRSPFRRFLTLKEAEALVFKEDEVERRTSTASEEDVVDSPVGKAIVMVFIGLLQVGCWAIVGLYTLFTSSELGAYQEVWKGVRPLLVAVTWLFTVIRRVQQPTQTAPLDLFAVYLLQSISGVVELGGLLYGYSVLGLPRPSTVEVAGYSLNLVGVLVVLGIVLSMSLGIPGRYVKKEEIGKSIAPEDYATLFSWLSFSWIHPLISRGKSCTLNESDVPNLSPTMQSRPVLERFLAGDVHKRTLLKRIWRANSSDMIIDAVGTLMKSGCMYLAPIFLNLILLSIDKDAAHITPADRPNAYIYACLMFLAALAKTQISIQRLWFARRAATRVRSELMGAIYDKALKRKDVAGGGGVSGERNEDESEDSKTKSGPAKDSPKTRSDVGKVVNLMAGDANTISNLITDMTSVWASPMDIAFGCVYLYRLLGWSAFAGFAVILAGWPLNTLLARRSIMIQKGTMAAKDKRMGAVSELIGAVKFIKFFAWEERWIQRVMEARENEIEWMVKARMNRVLYSFFWMSAPIVLSIVSFATYVIRGNELTVPKAFTAIALFEMIRRPLNTLPMSIVSILNAKVALDRIADFLGEEEVDEQVSTLKVPRHRFQSGDGGRGGCGLGLRNATLKWNEVKKSKFQEVQKGAGRKTLRNSWFGSMNSLRFQRSLEADSLHSSTNLISGTDATGRPSLSGFEGHRFELKNISVVFPEGELTVVTGPTASGKTALLMAVLGEMTLLSGELVLHKNPRILHNTSDGTYTQTISYTSQSPWLRHQTIRENILFGYPYEEKRYRDVVEACALRPDFDVLEDGDETEIGARGVSLSGGQKARVALARAVYARTKYVLLDDPLSAVDSHTSRYLYENLLCGPLLRGRTVVLVTHHVDLVLPRAYYLVRMLDGRIDTQGTVKELKERGLLDGIASEAAVNTYIVSAEKEEGKDKVDQTQNRNTGAERKRPGRKLVGDEHREIGNVKWTVYKKYLQASSYSVWVLLFLFVMTSQFLGVGEKVWMMQWGKSYPDDGSGASVFLAETLTSAFRPFLLGITNEHDYATDSYVHSQRNIHQVPLSVVNSYIINGATEGNDGASSGEGLFGIRWPSAKEHPLFYVGGYASIGLGSVLVNLCSVFVQYTGGLRASRVLFKQLLEKVVRATFRFHDTTPQGRMLNRFGKDMETIDLSLAGSFLMINVALANFFASVVTINIVFPLFLFPAALFGFIYRMMANLYLSTSRDLRRMESNSRSPIFSHFGELLEGIVTVRAFSAERQFMDGLHEKIDVTTKMWYAFWMTNRWLTLNFDFIGALAVFITALFSISRTDSAAAGIAGLCISCALEFTNSIYWGCRYWTNLEVDLNSVERVIEYLQVPQEPPAVIESNRPPAYWPSSNANNDSLIQVENLSIKYAPNLPEVLQDVSFTLRAGERVGLIGRTGSGKSTLAMSILRFVDPSSGRILIDGIDISTIGTYDLRSRLTFIPQDAALFSGTLRDNLDPFSEHTDEECLDVLYRVQVIHPGSQRSSRVPSTAGSPTNTYPSVDDDDTATTFEESYPPTVTDVESVSSHTIGLSTQVSSGGSNFSQGQRQLISLARALLKRSSVIVLDEATSSIDFATDEKIQTAIREEFQDSLLLTVAHRLGTVIDYDRLIVLDNGRMMEFDSPLNLIRKQDGIFRNMCLNSGNFAELQAAALAKGRDSG